jgi:hypothetical protein
MTKRKPKPKRKQIQRFTYTDSDGGKMIFVVKKIIPGTEAINLPLTEAHLDEAARNNGYGDAQRCAGAYCARDHADMFNHAVVGPFLFTDATLFIVSKKDALGHPIEAVQYEHSQPEISRTFDRGRAGVAELRKRIRDAGGTLWLRLKPKRLRVGETRKGGTGRRTGERTPRLTVNNPALRRIVRAAQGQRPPEPEKSA